MNGDGDAIVVLNAGSSSIKFCTFRRGSAALERELRGQVSGLGTAPRLSARRGADVVVDRALDDTAATHAQALDLLLDFLRTPEAQAVIKTKGLTPG